MRDTKVNILTGEQQHQYGNNTREIVAGLIGPPTETFETNRETIEMTRELEDLRSGFVTFYTSQVERNLGLGHQD